MKCTRSLSFLSCFAVFLVTSSPCVRAATITVTSSADSGPGTLRSAVATAADGDVINFSLPAGSRITLTSGELLVSKSISVVGPGWPNLTIDGNHASRAFHIAHVAPSNTVTLFGLTIMSCMGTGRPPANIGGAVLNEQGELAISSCLIASNSATRGGGLGNFAAVGAATLTITNCVFVGNSPIGEGGAIYTQSSSGSATVNVANSIFTGNSAPTSGGGAIYAINTTLVVSRSVFATNFAGGAAAIISLANNFGTGSGSTWISDSTFIGNSAHFNGGALWSAGDGHMTIVNSSLIGNVAVDGGAIVAGQSSVDVINSTLSGNSAQFGAAIYGEYSAIRVLNSTLSGNSSSSAGIYTVPGPGLVEIGSTILNAIGPNQTNIFTHGGSVSSLGYNLSSDGGGGFLTNATDQVNTDPMLGPLQDNGGPTLTHAVLCGSPAIDRGLNFSGLAIDQRGFRRTIDNPGVPNGPGSDGTDIGAFEAICDHAPVADASATLPLVISGNGSNAVVVLDGTRSFDPDGDALQYSWYEGGNLLASGAVAPVVLPVGTHSVQLVVSDGALSDTNAVTIEVITAAEAIRRLAAMVSANVGRPQPLLALLNAAIASLDRGNTALAINQLVAFENQVRAQLGDSALAQTLIRGAEKIIESVNQ